MSAHPTSAERAKARTIAAAVAAVSARSRDMAVEIIAAALAEARGARREDAGVGEPFGRAVLCHSGAIHQSLEGQVAFWYARGLAAKAQAEILVRELDGRSSEYGCGPHACIAIFVEEPESARLLRIARRRIELLEQSSPAIESGAPATAADTLIGTDSTAGLGGSPPCPEMEVALAPRHGSLPGRDLRDHGEPPIPTQPRM